MDVLKYVIYGFIALIIIIFSGVLLGKSWGPVKYILNYGEEEVVEDVPDAIANEFNNIANNFTTCFNSKDDNCLCNIKILTFPKGYYLAFIDKNLIEIERIKIENTQTTVGKENRVILSKDKNFNCYIDYKEDKININLIQKPAYLPLDMQPRILLMEKSSSLFYLPMNLRRYVNYQPGYDDYEFFDKMFYKQGNNICFVLKDKLSSEGQAHINKLSRCSPKPLNT